jgi:hypothetical protein
MDNQAADTRHFVRDNARVVTRNGMRTAALDTEAEMNAGPKELKEGFVRSLPDNGPVVMVNLLRFRRASADGDGSGWDAYTRYSRAIPPLLKGVGGTIRPATSRVRPMATPKPSAGSLWCWFVTLLGRLFSKWSPLRNTLRPTFIAKTALMIT